MVIDNLIIDCGTLLTLIGILYNLIKASIDRMKDYHLSLIENLRIDFINKFSDNKKEQKYNSILLTLTKLKYDIIARRFPFISKNKKNFYKKLNDYYYQIYSFDLENITLK